jgi:hypothetical protein
MRFDRLAQLLIQQNLLALYRKESCLSFSLYLVRAFFPSVLKTFFTQKSQWPDELSHTQPQTLT